MDNTDYKGCTATATDINGKSRKVLATTDHADSSYGHYVWVAVAAVESLDDAGKFVEVKP